MPATSPATRPSRPHEPPDRRNASQGVLIMARKKATDNAFVFFDVVYEDGARSSNRKVPSGELLGLDGDLPARTILEAEDDKIAQMSGRSRGPIKTLARSPGQ